MKTFAKSDMIPANTFPHVIVHNVLGRKGKKCRIVNVSGELAQIEFEDGYTNIVNRKSLRRSKEP